jgi:hypothetical protein
VTEFFGERWDAPIVEPPAQRIPTPVGQKCCRCEEPIVEGDQGFTRPCYMADRTWSSIHIHRECDLAGIIGHMAGVCGCTGYDQSRASARIAAQRWRERGM